MIPTKDVTISLHLLLQMLSLIRPASGIARSGDGNLTDFFKSPVLALRKESDRSISIDHSVKIIHALLSQQPSDESRPLKKHSKLHDGAGKETQFFRSIFNERADDRLARTSSNDVIQNLQKIESLASIGQLFIRLIKTFPSIQFLQKELTDKNKNPCLKEVIENFSQISSGRLSMKSIEKSRVVGEEYPNTEIKRFATQMNPSADHSLKTHSQIGEGRADQSVNRSALAIKLSLPPVTHARLPDQLIAPPALPVEINRNFSRIDKSIMQISEPGDLASVILPFMGLATNSTFLIDRRKKEKKHYPENPKESDDESNLEGEGFDL